MLQQITRPYRHARLPLPPPPARPVTTPPSGRGDGAAC